MSTYENILAGTHDLRLPDWGPYSKHLAGFSHIADAARGWRFDVSSFPGFFRRQVQVPMVRWESGHQPWECSADGTYMRYRHRLHDDSIYANMDYVIVDDERLLIRSQLVNRSSEPQNLVMHTVCSLHPPSTKHPMLAAGQQGLDLFSWTSFTGDESDPRFHLTYDGMRRGELRRSDCLNGVGLALKPQSCVVYNIQGHQPASILWFRLRSERPAELSVNGEVQTLAGGSEWIWIQVPCSGTNITLERSSLYTSEILIDAMLLSDEQAMEPQVEDWVFECKPQQNDLSSNAIALKWPQCERNYAIAWQEQGLVRRFHTDDLNGTMRDKVHNHVNSDIHGSGKGLFTDIFQKPFYLNPNEEAVRYLLVSQGPQAERHALNFSHNDIAWEEIWSKARARATRPADHPEGKRYMFSQERMISTTLSNIVYPARTRGQWIRHSTPGRWWDSLYTWDSGFIGLGLATCDHQRAIDNLNAYVTEVDDDEAAFIHHGSPVPVQHYLFQDLWTRTGDMEYLRYFYPRLKRYHDFIVGRGGSQATTRMKSGLLQTWDYFYNSGGWDDYPPQHYCHSTQQSSKMAPIVNTAHAIRTAKILRQAARLLGEGAAEYDEDIERLSAALQTYSWDETSGYFGYVVHDEHGEATGILQSSQGENYNMGLDGVSPLVAGAVNESQRTQLIQHLSTQGQLWCNIGLSTVDQRASYYQADGYWNGAVWMPHQWFMWKALLDSGEADLARRIAMTALDLWANEVDRTGHCFEHFLVQSGRGAGWHCFGGLSTPVLCWYEAYYKAGTFTAGFDTCVVNSSWQFGFSGFKATLDLRDTSCASTAVICLDRNLQYRASFKGQNIMVKTVHPGTIELKLPLGVEGDLIVEKI